MMSMCTYGVMLPWASLNCCDNTVLVTVLLVVGLLKLNKLAKKKKGQEEKNYVLWKVNAM